MSPPREEFYAKVKHFSFQTLGAGINVKIFKYLYVCRVEIGLRQLVLIKMWVFFTRPFLPHAAECIWIFLDITGGKPVKIVSKIWQIRDLWWQVYLWAQNTQNHVPIMQSEVYLLESLLHVLAHRISLSAPEGLLCMELLSFDVLSDIVFPKQRCCCTVMQYIWAALLIECMAAFVLLKVSLGEGTASDTQARP